MKLPRKFNTTKSHLKVEGDMSEKGADVVGIILASSGLILVLAFAMVMVLLAIHYIQQN